MKNSIEKFNKKIENRKVEMPEDDTVYTEFQFRQQQEEEKKKRQERKIQKAA